LLDALLWAAEHREVIGATAGKIGLFGESAGGNLAAVTCLSARDNAYPRIDHQALIYPGIYLAAETASRRRFGDGPILTREDASTFLRLYRGPDPDIDDWRAAPIRAPTLNGLPPTLIQIAGHDMLRDEGILFARALEKAGVHVQLAEYPAMPHGYLNFPLFSRDANHAMAQIVEAQRRALARATTNARAMRP
jgi:acetyl esterase